jgi:hypothetical protein
MLIEHIINKDMIKAKEVLREKMSILTAKLMLEMKKEIAARLSEGKVVQSPKHINVHDGPNYTANVLNGNTVHIVNKKTGETHLVKSPTPTPTFDGKRAANDPYPGHDKVHGHYTAMMPFVINAQHIADGNTEKLQAITDRDVHKLLISAVKTEKISEGTVVKFPNIDSTHETENHIVHSMNSGEVIVHNKETGKTYKTDAPNGTGFTQSLNGREPTDEDIEVLKRKTRRTAVSIN